MRLIASNEKPNLPETIVCPTHGEYGVRYLDCVLGKSVRYDACPECSKIESERYDALAREREERERLERLEKAKRASGLGLRHIRCELSNYTVSSAGQAKALASATEYVDAVANGSASCLIMCGKVGTGKTHLAAAMVNRLVERRIKCRIVKLADLVRDIKSTWAKGSENSEGEVIAFYSALPVLFIDEVGVQFGSDTEKMLISEIIDNRYQELRPTVLISNLDAQGVKQCIGDRSFDRLREDGGKVIAFDWESYRGAA